jgi:hypothetical protein
MAETKNIIAGFREVVQDLLVPELKAIRAEIEFMKKAMDSNTQEIRELRSEIKETKEITIRLLEKFDATLKFAELSERIARLEQKVNI